MTSQNPFTAVSLFGETTMRGVTTQVPVDVVRGFLPEGLELGAQSVTDTGFHPVLLFFNDMYRVRVSVPLLIPSMTYHEHHVGIPYTYLTGSSTGTSGPYYFMPKLHLDNWLAVFGGIILWGLAKEMTSVTVTASDYTVTSLAGQRLASLMWKKSNDVFRPASQFGFFAPIQEMLSQRIVSRVPASLGPLFSLADLDRDWEKAMLRPMSASLQVDVAYVQGYQCGRCPAAGWLPTISAGALGSYELQVPWRFSLPYPPPFPR